jgi:hypothetical protein
MDLLTDFYLGPPALCPAAPFFALPTATVLEASMVGYLASEKGSQIGDCNIIWLAAWL